MNSPTSPSGSPPPAAPPPRRRRRALRIGLVCLVLLAALVALAPTLVSTGPGTRLALALAGPFLPCEVEAGDLRAGWRSGVEIRDLRVVGPRGGEPFVIRRLFVSAPLRSLLGGPVRAVARIEGARATVRRRANGEIECAGFLAPPAAEPGAGSPSRGAPTGRTSGDAAPSRAPRIASIDLSFTGGELTLVDEGAKTEATLEDLSLTARASGAGSPIDLEGSGRLRASGRTGGFSVRGRVAPDRPEGEGEIRFESFDLAPLSPLVAAGAGIARVEGTVEGNLSASRSADGGVSSGGELRVRDLRLEGGRLGPRAIHEPSVTIRPTLRFDPSSKTVTAEGFSVTTSFGTLTGKGTASASKRDASAAASLHFDVDLAGAFDRARLFAPGIPAVSGALAGRVTATGEEGSLRIDFEAVAGNLGVSGPGVPTDVRVPPTVSLRAVGVYETTMRQALLQGGRLEAGPLLVNFAAAHEPAADGSTLTARAKAGIDLAQALPYLQPFDRGLLALGGALSSEFTLHADASGNGASLDVTVADFVLVRPGGAEARRERVEFGVQGSLVGSEARFGRISLSSGALDATASGSAGLSGEKVLEFHLAVNADLAEASAAARPFAPSVPAAAGRLIANLDVTGAQSAPRFSLRSTLAGVTRAVGEPAPPPFDATIECAGGFEVASKRLSVENGRVVAPFATLDFRGNGGPGPGGVPSFEGSASWTGDLSKAEILLRPVLPARTALAGTVRGDARASRRGASSRVDATLVASDLRLSGHARPAGSSAGPAPSPDLGDRLAASPFVESEARVGLAAVLDPDADRLVVEKAEARAAACGIEAKARGTVEAFSGAAFLDGAFDLAVDLDALVAAAKPLLPGDLRPSGRATGRFTFGGALRPDPLRGATASGTLDVPAVDVSGNAVRDAHLDLSFAGGALRIREGRARMNDGEVTLDGGIEFREGKPPAVAVTAHAKEVAIRRGLVLPLAHLVPIFATSRPELLEVSGAVNGDFAVRGEGLDWETLRRRLSGDAKVNLGAGSIAGSPQVVPLLAALNRRSSYRFRDVVAAFELADGRLSTDGIRIGGDDASLTLAGSTGLDGSLDYRIEVDLPASVERESWGAALESLFGKSGLPVGLTGSVTSPSLALRAPDLKEAAGGALQGGLGGLLEEWKKKREEDEEKKKKKKRRRP